MRVYTSTYHLWSAKHSAALARDREQVLGPGPLFSVRHRAYVQNAVIAAAAFVETAINEVYQDAADGQDFHVGPLSPQVRLALKHFWKASNDGQKYISPLDKYDFAKLFAGHEPMDHTRNPWADASSLIAVRNWMIHYKPEDFSDAATHRLVKRLPPGKFAPNALMAGSGNPYFPDHFFGAGLAEWAHTSAQAFVDCFTADLGLTLNYQWVRFIDEDPNVV